MSEQYSVYENENHNYTQQLVNLFAYAEASKGSAFSGFFAAMVEEEDLRPVDTTSEDESLAGFDRPSSIHDDLRFDQQLAGMQHQPALDTAGLAFENDAFSGGLRVVDGQKFVFALSVFDDEQVRRGATSVVRGNLTKAALAFRPPIDAPEHETYHLDPQLQNNSFFTAEDDVSLTEMLLNASEIANVLEQPGGDADVAETLRALHAAELEGMRGEWAVASDLGLFTRPTTSVYDSYWGQWNTHQDWQRLFDFLQSAVERHGTESPFLRQLIAGTAQKVSDRRQGKLAPAKWERPAASSGDEEGGMLAADLEEDDDDEELTLQFQQQYDQLLLDVETRLRSLL